MTFADIQQLHTLRYSLGRPGVGDRTLISFCKFVNTVLDSGASWLESSLVVQ